MIHRIESYVRTYVRGCQYWPGIQTRKAQVTFVSFNSHQSSQSSPKSGVTFPPSHTSLDRLKSTRRQSSASSTSRRRPMAVGTICRNRAGGELPMRQDSTSAVWGLATRRSRARESVAHTHTPPRLFVAMGFSMPIDQIEDPSRQGRDDLVPDIRVQKGRDGGTSSGRNSASRCEHDRLPHLPRSPARTNPHPTKPQARRLASIRGKLPSCVHP